MLETLHWYYLHENGSLIHKKYFGEDQRQDFSESTFVKMYWLVDTMDRESLWNLLIEAIYYGAKVERIQELATLWKCDAKDLIFYMARVKPTPDRRKGLFIFIKEVLKLPPDEWFDWLKSTPIGSSPDFVTMPKEQI